MQDLNCNFEPCYRLLRREEKGHHPKLFYTKISHIISDQIYYKQTMVWFQCEDCGENLKKPKLQNHFRICSANKFSCIDCGVIFSRQTVQAHTQCISEAEKYGPKFEGKSLQSAAAVKKPNTMENSDVNLNVGLSVHPPWTCSLCNVKATSKETLALHSEGKKHRSRAKASLANKNSNQTAQQSAQSLLKNEETSVEESKTEQPSGPAIPMDNNNSESESSLKKRKRNEHISSYKKDNGVSKKKSKTASRHMLQDVSLQKKSDTRAENGLEGKKATANDPHKTIKEVSRNVVKWKKIIKSVLKESPDKSMSLKKLQKAAFPLVMQKIEKVGISAEKQEIKNQIVKKVMSSSSFVVENNFVSLA